MSQNFFPEAITKPNEPIRVREVKNFIKFKLLFKKIVEVKDVAIIFNDETRVISFTKLGEVRQEETSFLILFFIASIVLMITSNILFKKNISESDITAASALAIILLFMFIMYAFNIGISTSNLCNSMQVFSFITTMAIISIIIFVLCLALFIAVINNKSHKWYFLLSIIYYILTTSSLAFLLC